MGDEVIQSQPGCHRIATDSSERPLSETRCSYTARRHSLQVPQRAQLIRNLGIDAEIGARRAGKRRALLLGV